MPDGADQSNVSGEPASRAAVERALAELRRGGAVIIVDHRSGQAAAIAVAGESADRAGPPLGLAGTAPACVVPRGRAAVLSLEPASDGNVAIRDSRKAALDFDPDFVRAIAGIADGAPSTDCLSVVRADGLQDTAVELVKLARLLPVAITARVTGDPAILAGRHDLLTVDSRAVAEYRALVERGGLALVTRAWVPLEGAADAEVLAFRPADGGKEHVAIVIGQPKPGAAVLTRIHSECFTGDLLGSLRCDCGEQLRGAIRAIASASGGILLYLAQEGRGIGLVNKLRAYRLQDAGFDTIDANERLGFDADERVYYPAAAILAELGFSQVRLLTNNPAKVEGLSAVGIDVVERVPHAFPANGHNDRYLRTKAARAGHIL